MLSFEKLFNGVFNQHLSTYQRQFDDPKLGAITIKTNVTTNQHPEALSSPTTPLTASTNSAYLPKTSLLPSAPEDSSSFCEQSMYFQALGHALTGAKLPQNEPHRIASINIDLSQSNQPNLGAISVHRVVDLDTAPAKGGMRFGEEGEVDLNEAKGLAKLMTDKNALWNTGMVGGKGVIAVPKGALPLYEPHPSDSPEHVKAKQARKENVIRLAFQELYFRGLIGPHIDVPAGDMRFGSKEVSQGLQGIGDIVQAKKQGNGRALGVSPDELNSLDTENASATITGKPVEEEGLEGRDEATGYGVAQTTKELIAAIEPNTLTNPEKPLSGKKVIVQGYGNVGSWSAKHLAKLGATIVGIAERPGVGNIHNDTGIDLAALDQHYAQHKTFTGFEGNQPEYSDLGTFLSQHPCPDILAPAAKEGQINEHVAQSLLKQVEQQGMQNFYIIEGANGPVTPKAESILNTMASKVHIAPGPYANGGGVFISCQERLKNLSERNLNKETAFKRLTDRCQYICASSTAIMRAHDLSFFRAVWSMMANNALDAHLKRTPSSSSLESTASLPSTNASQDLQAA